MNNSSVTAATWLGNCAQHREVHLNLQATPGAVNDWRDGGDVGFSPPSQRRHAVEEGMVCAIMRFLSVLVVRSTSKLRRQISHRSLWSAITMTSVCTSNECARMTMLYGSAIAVVTSLHREDKFRLPYTIDVQTFQKQTPETETGTPHWHSGPPPESMVT